MEGGAVPRLEPVEPDRASPEALEFYERDEQRYGFVLNNTKRYAHNLAILRAIKTFAALFEEADSLPLDLKALVRVRVATLNGCPF
jgi:hypothetical protein